MPVHDTSGVVAAITSGGFANLSLLTSVTSVDGTASYSYDPTGQLTAATYNPSSLAPSPSPLDESYTYDANGNRLSATGSASVIGTDNQLLSDGTYRYSYDAEGNRIERFIDVNQDGILDSGVLVFQVLTTDEA